MRSLYVIKLYLVENTFIRGSIKNRACVCAIIIPRINDISY